MPPFSYNVANNNRHQKSARKEASVNTIKAKGGVVNKKELVEDMPLSITQ
jgi:hypothetical protein